MIFLSKTNALTAGETAANVFLAMTATLIGRLTSKDAEVYTQVVFV